MQPLEFSHTKAADAQEAAFLRSSIVYPLKAHFYNAVRAAVGDSAVMTPEIRKAAVGFVDFEYLSHTLKWVLNVGNMEAFNDRARKSLEMCLENGAKIDGRHEYCLQAADRAFDGLNIRYGGRRIEEYVAQRAIST